MTAGRRAIRGLAAQVAVVAALQFAPCIAIAIELSGVVVDLNGHAVSHAQVSLATAPATGADVITVFADGEGRFAFPGFSDAGSASGVSARALGYEFVNVSQHETGDAATELTVIMRTTPNLAGVAPASAWLSAIGDRREKSHFVNNCVGCHQVPSAAVRNYAGLISRVGIADQDTVRHQSWLSITRYMNYLWGWEFSRGRSTGSPDPEGAYAVGPGAAIADTMSRYFDGPMDHLTGYGYGAPLITSPETVIREYEVPGTNAIREAMMVGNPKRLWVADVASNNLIAIDPASGRQEIHAVPFAGASGPHSLHRASDGSLWVTPFFPSVIARLDPDEESWQTWPMVTRKGETIGIHDLSFGSAHELLTDEQGLLWYSDIANNAVGYFDPDNGDAGIFRAPEIEGRPGAGAALYGLIMSSDRKHIWYSQLGIGSFGSFNVETRQFETRVVLPDADSGPRRLTISDDDIMYVPLYGAGQLVEYDTRAKRMLGQYDLPDTGSAPYAVTWDPVRKVVWIATSNADVIYRFDPDSKSFGVLPMPRAGALLRMIDIDPDSGVLVTSYANILEFVPGPRMALIIEPGDGAYAHGLAGAAP
jgi:streptogramin lyase